MSRSEELEQQRLIQLEIYNKYKQDMMDKYDFSTCLNELARGNFNHVNDTDPDKVMSEEITSAIEYHMESINNTNRELKSRVIRLLAYLSSFTLMCEKCCYPKSVCQCKENK